VAWGRLLPNGYVYFAMFYCDVSTNLEVCSVQSAQVPQALGDSES